MRWYVETILKDNNKLYERLFISILLLLSSHAFLFIHVGLSFPSPTWTHHGIPISRISFKLSLSCSLIRKLLNYMASGTHIYISFFVATMCNKVFLLNQLYAYEVGISCFRDRGNLQNITYELHMHMADYPR
jgi:hypothetical protein